MTVGKKGNPPSQSFALPKTESLDDEMLGQVSGGFIERLHPCHGCDAFTSEPENMNCFGKKITNSCPRGLKVGGQKR